MWFDDRIPKVFRLFPTFGLILAANVSCRVGLYQTPPTDPPLGTALLERTQAVVQETRTPSPSIYPTRPARQSNSTATPTDLAFIGAPETIGTSLSGRAIQVFRFGTGPVQRILIAGIHGGSEWNTIALARQLIDHFNKHPEAIPAQITLFILPVLNPDGAARDQGPDGRVNDRGVDLNRNFPAFWQKEWHPSGCWQLRTVTGGEAPLSEPESRALVGFLSSQTIDALVSYHSAGPGIYPGGQPPDESSSNLAEALSKASDYPYPPVDTGCRYTGQLVDWASIKGIAAVDVELTNHHDTDLERNLSLLSRFLRWRSFSHSGAG